VGDMTFEGVTTCDENIAEGDRVACVLRPEGFSVREPEEPSNVVEGAIEWSAFVGPITEVKISVGGVSLLIDAPPDRDYLSGETLRLYLPKDKTIVLPWMDL
jgi:ABC-type Fe3+/spermidine/putrescine transport system ATPase subunit